MKRIIDYPSDKDKDDNEDRNNTWRYVCRMKELPQGKSEQFTIRDEKQSMNRDCCIQCGREVSCYIKYM